MMDINNGKLLIGKNSLNQSINLIVLTSKNERVLNRTFGSDVITFLDQPINNVYMDISAEVISSIQDNDSRISVNSVQITNNNDSGLIIDVNYNLGESTSVRT